MWHMGDGWGWWMASGWLWMIIITVLIVWAVATISRGRPEDGRAFPRADDRPSAIETLRHRYARGELSDEEFEHRRRVLEHPTNKKRGGRGEAPFPRSAVRHRCLVSHRG
jgi:putative membrane protein